MSNRPKIVQIAVAPQTEGDFMLYGIDNFGQLWEYCFYHPPRTELHYSGAKFMQPLRNVFHEPMKQEDIEKYEKLVATGEWKAQHIAGQRGGWSLMRGEVAEPIYTKLDPRYDDEAS